jgi:hypothetical protein
MDLLTADMKITNTSTEIITDVRIRTTATTAEAIEITTTIIIEAKVTTETTIQITTIIITSMKKVLNHIKTGVHRKERNTVIYNLLAIIVLKIITSNKSTVIMKSTAIMTKKAVMGTTSELTWI